MDITLLSHVKFLCTSHFGTGTFITPLKLTYTLLFISELMLF